jgi:hypothetical protein
MATAAGGARIRSCLLPSRQEQTLAQTRQPARRSRRGRAPLGDDESELINGFDVPFFVSLVAEPQIPPASSAGQLLVVVAFGGFWIADGRVVSGCSCLLLCALLNRGPVLSTCILPPRRGGSRHGGDVVSPSAQSSVDCPFAQFLCCLLSVGAAESCRRSSNLLERRLMKSSRSGRGLETGARAEHRTSGRA